MYILFLCNFSPAHVSCQLIQFCPENQGFSLLRVIMLQNSFLCALLRILCIFLSAAFYLKSKEKLPPCAYNITVFINSLYIAGNATICNYPPCAYIVFTNSPISWKCQHFPTIHCSKTGKNRDKSINNRDKSGENRYKKLYSPITF